MTENMRTEITENGIRINKLRAVECKTLEERISVDATINELELDTKGMWYQYYYNPHEEDIEAKLNASKQEALMFGDPVEITEEDVRTEYKREAQKIMEEMRRLESKRSYFASIMRDFPDVKIIDLETIDKRL